MAESADDPELFWVDPTRRGILPLDAFHVPRRLRRVVRQRRLRDPLRHRLRGGHARLRRGQRKAPEHLDQRRDRAALYRRCSRAARRTASNAGTTASWSAGSTASRSAPRSSARACSAASTDASKVALVHLVGAAAARRLSPARHAVPDAASGAVRRDRDLPRALSPAARRGAALPRRSSRADLPAVWAGAGAAAAAAAAAPAALCSRAG